LKVDEKLEKINTKKRVEPVRSKALDLIEQSKKSEEALKLEYEKFLETKKKIMKKSLMKVKKKYQ